MGVKAVTGANWGDEGKGKITDILAKNADAVVRFQGGSNAGHTIINKYGKFALHQLPSGIFYPHVTNILANGVALNPAYLAEEINMLAKAGVNPDILVSDRAQVLAPYHILLDQYEEQRLGDRKFGSTKSGIAPLYSDKYAKSGIQVWELYSDGLKAKLREIIKKNNILFKELYNAPALEFSAVYEELRRGGEFLRKYVADTAAWLYKAVNDGKNILLEGQLGALKDIDHGIYPYVTSSPTLAGYGAVGAGIAPYHIKDILAVTKAYSSAVGEGPFVSEIFGEEAEELRRKGGDAGEYGATTGRPRRVGYFDTVATRYGARIQGATEIALTGIDVLSYMEEIPVCVAYEIDGKMTKNFPTLDKLMRAKPVIQRMPGFRSNIRGATSYERLPEAARAYIGFLASEIGVPIKYVSTGPKREEIIEM